ncbi:MAG: DUF5110 domain-containing protein [Saprospiraceae bacterium]|nr:DUF5110 domain-containing protein [Saprospiraceae bacterium]
MTDFYFGLGGLLDIFRKDTQKWFWSKHDEQNQIGVDAWWGDLGEPEKHPLGIFHNLRDMGHSRLFRSDEVHNLYGHTWTKMLFENYALQYPDVRLFSLNRSGFAGSQRFNIIPWSGDVSRSWSGFQAQPLIMLGMSMSGIQYIHADAGGFAGGEGDYELYVRWLQFAAFTPIFRPHGTALFETDPKAYSFPSEPALMPEPYKSIVRKVIQMRYKLLPYNYTLTYRQAQFGDALVSPLYYNFPDDKTIENIEDQFMWGENIMVAPILYKNQQERKVILPQGFWYRVDNSFNCSKALSGELNEKIGLEDVLLYVKAGSFIPLIDKEGKTSEDYTTDSLTIHYYYGEKKSNYTLYDDNGLSKTSLEKNNYELISFHASPKKFGLDINVTTNRGKYPEKPTFRIFNFVIHQDKSHKMIKIDGKIIPYKTDHNGNTIFSVKMMPNKKNINIRLN